MAFDADTELQLDLGLDERDDEAHLRARVAAMLEVDAAALPAIEVRKRAVDARRGRIRFHLTIGRRRDGDAPLGAPDPRAVSGAPVVIVGGGRPACSARTSSPARASRRSSSIAASRCRHAAATSRA
jgi:hypothetical protein